MKRVSSLSTESIIRIIPASEKPQSLSVATTTKKSVARVLEFDFRNAHANERLIEETQKQIENKRLFVDELTTKITQLKSERDALEIDLQNTQRQLALAHEWITSEDAQFRSSMAPLRAELSKILLEITHYSRKNTALFEKKFQDFLVEQMKTVGWHEKLAPISFSIEIDKHRLLRSFSDYILTQDTHLQTFTARKKALQDLIDQTIRSHNEKEAQLSQEQTAHHEKVQSLQSEIRAIQLAIDDIETRLAPPREELASLESTLVHLIHKRENTQKELMRRESDAIAKSLNFRDAFPSYLLDENTDRKGHQENVTIRFDVREKWAQEKSDVSSPKIKDVPSLRLVQPDTRTYMPSESGTPALLGGIESASPSVDNHRVDVKDPELQEIEVYDRQMKVFHTLASEVYTELNSRFYQLLVFIHEAHDIIAQLNKVGLFSAKDIRKWNNQRQYRMELERAELRMTRSKSSKIINDLSNQKESFLEQIRLNGDIDILHAKQSEDLASLRQKIGEYKATFIDFKRVIDLHTARIAEYPTFHDAVSADALNFGSLSYIQSQILSCEHYIMACEQSLMHAEARLQDPNIAIIDAKASKTNADRRDSALNLSVPNQEFQFLPFPEDTFTWWKMVAIKSIKYLACSDASVSLYGTLPGMEVDDIHAFVDTCLKSIVTDKECMNVLVRPLRLSHYSFPPSTQGTLAETALIDAFRQWFRSLNAWPIEKRFVLGFDTSIPELHSYTVGIRKSYFEEELFRVEGRLKADVFNYLLEIMLVDIVRDFFSRPHTFPDTIPFVQHFTDPKYVYSPRFKSIDDLLNKTDFFVLNELQDTGGSLRDLTSYDITIGTGHSKFNPPKKTMIPEWSRLLRIESTNGYCFDHYPILFDKTFVLPYFYHYVDKWILGKAMRPLDIYASVVQEVLSNNASDRAQGFPSFDRRDIQEVTRNAFKDKTTYFPYSINPTVTDDMIRQALLTIYVGNEDIEERSKGFFQK